MEQDLFQTLVIFRFFIEIDCRIVVSYERRNHWFLD